MRHKARISVAINKALHQQGTLLLAGLVFNTTTDVSQCSIILIQSWFHLPASWNTWTFCFIPPPVVMLIKPTCKGYCTCTAVLSMLTHVQANPAQHDWYNIR